MALIRINSEVAGSVWKIETGVGDCIAQDESIMIIESMEIPLLSSHSGLIVEILVSEGDAVEDGQVLAIIET
jgi:acetyl-CoA carboxylase biotin carboxyl carrier protein